MFLAWVSPAVGPHHSRTHIRAHPYLDMQLDLLLTAMPALPYHGKSREDTDTYMYIPGSLNIDRRSCLEPGF